MYAVRNFCPKKHLQGKTHVQISYLMSCNNPQETVENLFWRNFSYLFLQQLKNEFFVQVICTAKAKAKKFASVERFTLLILFLVFLQSEFANSLLFMQNKFIPFFHIYRILTVLSVWVGLFSFSFPASFKLTLSAQKTLLLSKF